MRDALQVSDYARMIAEFRGRVVRAAQPILVGVVPTFLLVAGIAHYMLNNLFVRAPYLLDTGMLSGLAYRDGLLLAAPKVALSYVEYYYDVYFSPLTSLFSLASYIVPVGRLEWYVIIQAAVYAPIGPAVFLVASRLEPATALRRAPITIAAAIAFCFSGLVLWMVGYPHFEVAMPGFICLMLASIVTGRTRWAWVWLVFAASVRQDGGIHVATALAPLVFLHWRGFAMLPSRRALVQMMGFAVGLSVVGMLAIKVFFHPFPRLEAAYIGNPMYAHLSLPLLAERARSFIATDQLIYYPALATALLAALRRDYRYLLGWISTLPWFVFCFLAVETVKATFFAYGVGPFMIGMFWCYLYGAHLAPAPRRLRAALLEAWFAGVCLVSALGAYLAGPVGVRVIVEDMAQSYPRNRAAVHGFVHALRDHRASFGRLRVDAAIATVALEELDPSEAWRSGETGVDTIAFHRESIEANGMINDLLANQIDGCALVRRTGIAVCSRNPAVMDALSGADIDIVPSPVFDAIMVPPTRRAVLFERRGVVFRHAHVLEGWLPGLARGTYEWTFELAPEEPMRLDGPELAAIEVIHGNDLIAKATVPGGAHELVVRFDAPGDAVPVAYHFGARPRTPLVVTSARLRRVAAP